MQVIEFIENVKQRVSALKNQFSQQSLLFQQEALLHTAFLLKPLACLVHCSGERLLRGRLQNEIRHPALDSLLSILKVRKACKQNHLNARIVFPDPAAKLQSVHLRHANVCNQNVRWGLLNLMDSIYSVVCNCSHTAVVSLPVNQTHQPSGNYRFIVHKHHSVRHGFSPLCLIKRQSQQHGGTLTGFRTDLQIRPVSI